MNDHHMIQPLAAAHRILHSVHFRAQPDGDVAAAQLLRQLRLADQSAVSQMARSPGHAIAQKLLPRCTPQAIGSDHCVSFMCSQAGLNRNSLRGLCKSFNSTVCMQHSTGLPHSRQQ